jgi:hypothetical protein
LDSKNEGEEDVGDVEKIGLLDLASKFANDVSGEKYNNTVHDRSYPQETGPSII